MNAITDRLRIKKLGDVYPPYAKLLDQYMAMLSSEPEKAEEVFARAQEIYRAWHAGVEYGERGKQ